MHCTVLTALYCTQCTVLFSLHSTQHHLTENVGVLFCISGLNKTPIAFYQSGPTTVRDSPAETGELAGEKAGTGEAAGVEAGEGEGA